ncbi:S9 family peptidase [Bacillus cereus group sp. BfR-BA-01380]|uniref:alpha/beta hydrolase family protein n=1 Tax=Bacillus cereus group sp. BfR-BA-01380 TaxID=2920324 RepID=UPI001F59CC1E|nr:alpha/beta fold hydrolase [Bacillus cereus group sp. BfR-BA-01380]
MKKILLVLGIVILGLVGWVFYQNSYDMKQEEVTIQTKGNTLHGVVTLPKEKEKPGLIIFVHGDGPVNATYDDGYLPLWEELAKKGYASLAWDKPGIGKSTGDWLDQSMEDRASEVIEVIEWAKKQLDIDTKKIGLWGASQGGWVVPKIANASDDVSFSILVSPAINWIEQGKYYTEKSMTRAGATKEEINQRMKNNEKVLELLLKNSNYEEYQNVTNDKGDISKESWNFIKKNVNSDATKDLSETKKPVKLIVGGRDENVDVKNTMEVYKKEIRKELLAVSYLPEANHSMLKPQYVNSEFGMLVKYIFDPRGVFDDKYVKSVSEFVDKVNR